MGSFLDSVTEALRLTWSQLQTISPRALSALLFLTVGWAIARMVRRLTIKLLRILRLETVAERTGVEDFLLRGGVRFTAVTLIGNLLYWIMLGLAVLTAFNALGIVVSAGLLTQAESYFPRVMLALAIVVFGIMGARFLRAAVHTYLNNVGVEGAPVIAFLTQIAVLAFAATLALQQLAIGGEVLVSAFQLAFGGICLALALAFGFGGREWAASILERTRKGS